MRFRLTLALVEERLAWRGANVERIVRPRFPVITHTHIHTHTHTYTHTRTHTYRHTRTHTHTHTHNQSIYINIYTSSTLEYLNPT